MLNKRNMMFFISLMFVSVSCNSSNYEVGLNYWKENNQIRTKCLFVDGKLDGYCYRFYKNGQLMSKAFYKKDRLIKIFSVFDTNGRKLDYGNLDKNGSGYVNCYNDELGTIEHSGKYLNGRREGWWKNYTYKGELTDSVFYKNSRPDFLNLFDIVMY